MWRVFLNIRTRSSQKFRESEKILRRPANHRVAPAGRPRPGGRGSLFGPAAGLAALARLGGRPGAHPRDLALWQSDADFADPFQLDAVDGLGIEARKVDRIGRLAALDGLQVALAGLQPHHRLLAEEARERV